jgi:ABC-2 type transport system permease protein
VAEAGLVERSAVRRGVDDARVYRRLVGAAVRAEAQYRGSFGLHVAAQILVVGTNLAAILVLFTNVTSLAGWSVDEVVLVYALSTVSFTLAELAISQVSYAGQHIRAGTFDLFLVRPLGVLTQLSAREFSSRRAVRVAQPLVVLGIVIGRVGVDWTAGAVLMVPVTVLSGAAIFGAVFVVTSALSFWMTDAQEVSAAFTYGGDLMTSYPMDLYGPWLQRLVVFVVPLAFVAYLPAAWLLGKERPLGLPADVACLTPLVAAVAALAARTVWTVALRHYRSTGS